MKTKVQGAAGYIKRHKTLVICAAVLLGVFLLTRIINILGVPMFNDEAIYIRWAELFSIHPRHNLFISLTDGKQPTFIWLMGISLRSISDPLLAGRVISVLAGMGSMVGIYILTKELFSKQTTAIIAVCSYIIYPYSLLYDRMALYDSLLAMFAIWTLYAQVLLIRHRSYRVAAFTAIVMGVGLLTKSGAFFFIYLMPLSLILYRFKYRQILTDKKLRQWFICALIAVVGAYALYSLLRFSPDFKYIASKNGEFTLTLSEWIKRPFGQLPHTVGTLTGFVVGYSTVPFLLLVLGSFVLDRKYSREKILLISWTILPLTAFALFARLLYPRYILFMMMPLLPLAAYAVESLYRKIKRPLLSVPLIITALIPIARSDYFIISDFAKAPVPKLDKYAYIEGFYSGVGVRQVVDILNEKSKNQKIYVATQGGFGIMPQSLQDYLYKNKNVIIESFAGLGEEPPTQVKEALKLYPVYHVFTAPCPACESIGVAPKTWKVNELLRVKRIEDNSYLTLVEIVQ